MPKTGKNSSDSEAQGSGSKEKQTSSSKSSEQNPCPVVSIGASAGGFHAVQDLLANLPSDSGMALVLIQHLKAEYDSNLPHLLAKSTSLPISMAEDNEPIKPNQVYILPPGQIMEIKNRRLHLSPRTAQAGKFRPIDHFFASLAKNCKEEALAVILSGSGSDGSAGLREIKAEGEIVLAQDETSAEFSDMPRHAAETGLVDFILPPEQIATKLGDLCRHPHLHKTAMTPGGDPETLEPEAFSTILKCLKKAGIDFTQYKQSTVGRRITRRMALHKIEDPEKYADFIHSHPEEIAALKEDMLIKVTSFFRDPEVFEVLRQEVFPRIIQQKEDSQPIRIWVPGCATGEEAYSLAISMLDFMEEKRQHLPLQIFGTDLSETAINKARKGIYSATEVNSLSENQLNRHFSKSDSDYQIKKSLREHCIFAQQDFTRDPPFSRIDLISCRNVLIYLGPELQKKAMSIFHYALAPEGALVLGSSENIGRFDNLFHSLDKKHRIYTKIKKAEQVPLHFIPKHAPVQAGKSETKKERSSQPEETIDMQSEADRILLQKYQPAAVVVDSSMNILHFRGETGLFLQHLPGKASLNLLKMIKDSLRIDLRSLIHRAQQEKRAQRKSQLPLLSADGPRTVTLEVTPFSAGNTEECFLIQFEQEPDDQTTSTAKPEPGDDTSLSEIERLKQDLSASHEYAQSLLEEKESAMEELNAANEEIMSSNEELQSINEELETATQGTELNSDQQGFLKIAHTSASALTDLLSEILDLARIEVNKMNLEHTTYNIRETAEDSINILRGEAQRKKIKLNLNVSDKVPEVLLGDRVRLRQVLINLVGNAIKFTEQGDVSVQLDAITDSIGRPMLSLCVSDTGVGIPEDKLETIFAYFTQVDASKTRKYGGTGLGLSICKGIVERMGGSISVASKHDRGSTFTVTIPLCPADKDIAEKLCADEQNTANRTQAGPYQVLIVEDEPLILKLIEKLLSAQDWKPTSAVSGKQALQILQQKKFDLVLMDLHMLDMDGIQTTKKIREQEQQNGGHLPIIALTAYADNETKEKCFAAGMDDYVTKPFSKEKLIGAIRQQMEDSSPA